jgi:hypothetical protein
MEQGPSAVLIIVQQGKKYLLYMEHQGSLPCSEEAVTATYR